MDLTIVKQRFGIIGNNDALNRALEVALRVAPTDLSVLVTGESGVGKEFFPQIIHANSSRKNPRTHDHAKNTPRETTNHPREQHHTQNKIKTHHPNNINPHKSKKMKT